MALINSVEVMTLIIGYCFYVVWRHNIEVRKYSFIVCFSYFGELIMSEFLQALRNCSIYVTQILHLKQMYFIFFNLQLTYQFGKDKKCHPNEEWLLQFGLKLSGLIFRVKYTQFYALNWTHSKDAE